MTYVISWLVFPLVLGLLSLGCGLLLRHVAFELPAPLLLPAGFAVLSVVSQFPILSERTADFAAPLVVALAFTGFALSSSVRLRSVDSWCVAAGAGTFGVFAAPFVASGRPTFGGYIKLDDTATYLAMLDRALQHGHEVAGLAPSTYEATLETSLAYGYPLGSLMPLGVGRVLVGLDALWLWQPYLTFLAALVALSLYQLVSGLVRTRFLRAVVAFVGAQPALLYGYALWGGIKELATAAMLILAVALVPAAVSQPAPRVRAVLPLAATCAAILGILSLGGAVWLAPVLGGALVLAVHSVGFARALGTAAAFLLVAALLAGPSFVAAASWLPRAGGFTNEDQFGNLRGSLSWLQAFGIWPNRDFRVQPESLDVTRVLLAVVLLAAALALVLGWQRRTWELPLALATGVFACVVYVGFGSPWIGAKALATSAPVFLAAALAGAAAVFEGGRRIEAMVAAGLIVAGVAWSNALQYHGVLLAPTERLGELESIGERFAAQGPALVTEYEPYGVRHFLRNMDAEGASELRRHFVPLRAGGVAELGVHADIDEFELGAVLYYRTLVLRRSPLGSRPPSTYRIVATGRYYDVWQRPEQPRPILEHLSLGDRFLPSAEPSCTEVLRLARLAAAHDGLLATVNRTPTIVIRTNGSANRSQPLGRYGEDPSALYLSRPYLFEASFSVPEAGRYGVWVGGSFQAELKVSIDDARIGIARHQQNWPSSFSQLGSAQLGDGTHELRLEYSGPDLRPGSGGAAAFGLGPIAIGQGTADRPVTYVEPENARSLCSQSLDWIEALPS